MRQDQPRYNEEKQEDWVNGKWLAMGRLALPQKHKRSCKEGRVSLNMITN